MGLSRGPAAALADGPGRLPDGPRRFPDGPRRFPDGPRRFLSAPATPPLLVLAVAAALHLAWFMHPLAVVFDEVYFPRFALAYLRGEYFFDIHPPLGKLVFAATAWIAGLDPSFTYASNHLPYPDPSYVVLRVPARIAGTLLPVVLYALGRELGLSRWAAFVAALLAALDNALLVMSRFALMDALLLLAGFAALLVALRDRAGRAGPALAAGLLAGAALAIKWTGLAFVGLVLLLQAARWLQRREAAGLVRIALTAATVAAVYVGAFAAHFALLPRYGPDAAFMSPGFQATLQGSPHAAVPEAARPGFAARLVETHRAILDRNLNTPSHPYGSRWHDWPFMLRAVDLWADHRDGTYAHIMVLGNPAVWWPAGYAMLLLLVNFGPKLAAWLLGERARPADPPETQLVVAWLANFLPFVAVGRVMFLYHYLAALCVSLLMLGLLVDRSGRHAGRLGMLLLVLAVAGFAYFAPLSYGLPLAPADFDGRFWLRGWR